MATQTQTYTIEMNDEQVHAMFNNWIIAANAIPAREDVGEMAFKTFVNGLEFMAASLLHVGRSVLYANEIDTLEDYCADTQYADFAGIKF